MTGVKTWGAVKKENEQLKERINSLQQLTLTVADALECQLECQLRSFAAKKEEDEIVRLLTIVNCVEKIYVRRRMTTSPSDHPRKSSQAIQPARPSRCQATPTFTKPDGAKLVKPVRPTFQLFLRPPQPLPPLPAMRRSPLPQLVVRDSDNEPLGPILVPEQDEKVGNSEHSSEEESCADEADNDRESIGVEDNFSGDFGPPDEPLGEVLVDGWDAPTDSDQGNCPGEDENEENGNDGGYTNDDEYEPCDGNATDENDWDHGSNESYWYSSDD